jgi:regulator of sigma E protease
LLILVHELGHFFTARKFGIKVEEFGFGYPPRIFGKKIGETIYSLNLLPFGGFVRMLGEDSATQIKNKSESKRAFFAQTRLKRALVLLAGVAMNFLLGVILFAGIFAHIGVPEQVDYLIITNLADDSPAVEAGLKQGDRIIGFSDTKSFIEFVNDNRGEVINLKLQDGQEVNLTPRLVDNTPEGQGALGVAITNVDTVKYPLPQSLFKGAWYGLQEALAWGRDILASLGSTIYGLTQGKKPEAVAGPVGIYEISKGVIATGLVASLQFVAILSVNLSILNLLPLPALDGGRLMFILIEVVARRRVKPELEQIVHLVGMLLLISLMVIITWADVMKL